MTPDTVNALVNMGAAGAVIAVVIIFLKSNEKRDSEWRSFFLSLRQTDAATTDRLAKAVENTSQTLAVLIDEVRDHDKKVVERLAAAVEAGRQGATGNGSSTDPRPRNGIR